MTIVEAVYNWVMTCPDLADGRLSIDWLPEDAKTFSIDVVPCQEIVKRYTAAGITMKQFQFNLASRCFNGEDIRDAQDNYAFQERFTHWVEQGNMDGNLPELGENRNAQSVRVNTSGYPMQIFDDGTARFQIQMTLRYMEELRNG